MTPPLRVMPGKVLIRPDVDRHAVAQTTEGLYVATTLAAAVDGEDASPSWYTGTVIAMAPARSFDVRPFLRRQIRDLLDCATYPDLVRGCEQLLRDLDVLPQVQACGFGVGDAVTFSAQAGAQITIDGATYLILAEHEVLGVLECA